MKKFLTFVAVAVLASPAFAINVATTPVGPHTFDTQPVVTDWAGGSAAGNAAAAATEAALDTVINGLAHTAASTVLAEDTSATVSQSGSPRWNSVNDNLELNATGVAAALLKATLNNTGTNYITGLTVNYDYSNTGAGVEEIDGLRVYWSGTGAAGSWTPLGTFGATGPVSLSLTGLGTNFGSSPFYLLWADDNSAASGAANEHQNTIDNVTITPTTFGGPIVIVPPTPEFGNQSPPAANTVGAGALDIANQTGGVTLDEAGNNVLHLNNGSLSLLTEQVDLRGVDTNANQVRVSVDLRTLDSSDGSDFEVGDNIIVTAEYSVDGLSFTSVELANLIGGTATADPLDELKPLDTGAGGAFTNFATILPSTAETVRVRVSAVNNSGTENFYLDNLNVSLVPVPEPATIAMFGLGLIGLVGYRRRRSA